MARFTAPRSRVGAAMMDVVPEKVTSATLNVSGSMSTNSLAACWAASIRLGDTSCERIERETSIVTTTVARSRGTGVSAVGWAKATTKDDIANSDETTDRWRLSGESRGITKSRRVRTRLPPVRSRLASTK